MTTSDVALLLTALGLGAVLQSVIAAVSQRRKVGADTMSVLTAAARELVEPLRKELAQERAEHSAELNMEQEKVREVRSELRAALDEVSELRDELAAARREAEQMRRERELDHARIRELEARLA